MSPYDDERICDKYGDSIIPFYRGALSVMGIHLPINAFEIEVQKNLTMDPSQLHPSRWA